MANYYFTEEEDELCFKEEYFIDIMKSKGLTQMNLILAERQIGSEYFYCSKNQQCGEKGECGKQCEDYTPRNGKNGCCKHNRNIYEPIDDVILKIDGTIITN